jgi:hypothetical protein
MEEIYCSAGNPLHRVSERRRDAAWIASLLDEPATRLIPLRDLKPAMRKAARGSGSVCARPRAAAIRDPDLYFGRAAHCIDDAGKLDQRAAAGSFDEAAVVLPDLWVDQFALRCL